MDIYINGMGNISPQQTWGEESLLSMPLTYTGNKLTCVEPDYSSYVDVKLIRRMSRIIKMGVASASMAIKESGATPDGIITATGYGCLEDTGIFLAKLVENKEQALNPTPFIQSTHNTIGSQIALLLQCLGYNQTYAHGAFSFESALLDAILQLSDTPDQSIVAGAIDEVTSLSHTIQSRFGIFRGGDQRSLELFQSEEKGTINGEGSSFFVLSGIKKPGAGACIKGVTTFYKPKKNEIRERIGKFLAGSTSGPEDIDLVLSGKCGDPRLDKPIDSLINDLFPRSSTGVFKHLCGEFPTASGFAVWLAANMLKRQQIPNVILDQDRGRGLRNILIYNQYFGTHHSFLLLQAC